jgi:hypothetical protein
MKEKASLKVLSDEEKRKVDHRVLKNIVVVCYTRETTYSLAITHHL